MVTLPASRRQALKRGELQLQQLPQQHCLRAHPENLSFPPPPRTQVLPDPEVPLSSFDTASSMGMATGRMGRSVEVEKKAAEKQAQAAVAPPLLLLLLVVLRAWLLLDADDSSSTVVRGPVASVRSSAGLLAYLLLWQSGESPGKKAATGVAAPPVPKAKWA